MSGEGRGRGRGRGGRGRGLADPAPAGPTVMEQLALAASRVSLEGGATALPGGIEDTQAAERRVAPDGRRYTRHEFEEFFGGLTEWHAAAENETPQAAAPAAAGRAAVANAVGVVTVGNLSGGKKGSGPAPPGFVDVRVDRQTALGNPFPMGEDGHDESYRDAVCEACEVLVDDPLGADLQQIASRFGLRVDSRFRNASALSALDEALRGLEDGLRAGENLRLLCCCVPKRCHGHGIAKRLVRNVEGASLVDHPRAGGPVTRAHSARGARAADTPANAGVGAEGAAASGDSQIAAGASATPRSRKPRGGRVQGGYMSNAAK